VSLPEIETIVRETVDALPARFRRAIANVDIAVEDEPPPGRPLLGLYEGIPLTRRGGGYGLPSYSGTLPDRITIYRGPLERHYGGDPGRFTEAVRHVVQHELAHYFGISDERLHELGAY